MHRMTVRPPLLLALAAIASFLVAPVLAWLLARRALGPYAGSGAGEYFARLYQGAAALEWQALAVLFALPATVGIAMLIRRAIRRAMDEEHPH